MLVQIDVCLISRVPTFEGALRGKVRHQRNVWRWPIKLTLMGVLLKWWGSTGQRHSSSESVEVDIAEGGEMVCGGRRKCFVRHVHPGVAINTSGTLCGPPDGLKGQRDHVIVRPSHGHGSGCAAHALKTGKNPMI